MSINPKDIYLYEQMDVCTRDIRLRYQGESILHHFYRTIIETIGLLDAKDIYINRSITIMEYLASLDSISKFASRFRTVTEYLGLLDSFFRRKDIYRTFIEKLGNIPTVQFIYHWVTGKKYHDNPNKKVEKW